MLHYKREKLSVVLLYGHSIISILNKYLNIVLNYIRNARGDKTKRSLNLGRGGTENEGEKEKNDVPIHNEVTMTSQRMTKLL